MPSDPRAAFSLMSWLRHDDLFISLLPERLIASNLDLLLRSAWLSRVRLVVERQLAIEVAHTSSCLTAYFNSEGIAYLTESIKHGDLERVRLAFQFSDGAAHSTLISAHINRCLLFLLKGYLGDAFSERAQLLVHVFHGRVINVVFLVKVARHIGQIVNFSILAAELLGWFEYAAHHQESFQRCANNDISLIKNCSLTLGVDILCATGHVNEVEDVGQDLARLLVRHLDHG